MDLPSRSARNQDDFLSPHGTNTRRARRLTSPGSSPSRDNDDLFLDLAKDTPNTHDVLDSASLVGGHITRRRTSHVPSDSIRPTKQYTPIARSLSGPGPSYPSTSHRLDSFASRHARTSPQTASFPVDRRGSAGEVNNNLSMKPFRPSSFKPSNLSNVTYDEPTSEHSLFLSNWNTEPSPSSPLCTDGVESVGSVTAVSTVWDEVEDLKGRIERYRTSGRRLTSSGATIEEHGERPRTATTMTTTSSSHAHQALKRTAPSRVDSSGNKTYELLRTALSKVKPHVDPSVYQSLESCASDAIRASSMLELADPGTDADSPSSPAVSSTDKRVRRKVDNICRTLTELCIAMIQEGTHNGTRLLESRVESRHTERPLSRVSTTPRDGFSPSHYLEERRARLERIGSGSRPASSLSRQQPISSDYSSPNLVVRHPSAVMNARPRRISLTADAGDSPDSRAPHRTSTILSGGDSEDRDSTVRAPSMTATDIPSSQLSPLSPRQLQQIPRDYTDRSPLPDIILPSLQKTLHTNQSNASLNSAYTTMTYHNNYRPRLDYARGGADLRAGSTLLEQRLEQRRQQQKVASSNQLGSITGLSEVPREYSRSRDMLASFRRPQSSGQVASRR